MRRGPCSWGHMFGNWDLILKINCSVTAVWDIFPCHWQKMAPLCLSFWSPQLWADSWASHWGPRATVLQGPLVMVLPQINIPSLKTHSPTRFLGLYPPKDALCSKVGGWNHFMWDRCRFHFNIYVVTFLCIIENTISTPKCNFRGRIT